MDVKDETQLTNLYESLDYFYRGPALPYIPQGVYYSERRHHRHRTYTKGD